MRAAEIIRIATASALVAAAIGCNDDRIYVDDDGALHQLAITEDTEPAFVGDEGDALYVVERRVELSVRAPTEGELDVRQAAVADFPGLPFWRMPWVERGDIELGVDFTVSNLDDEEHDIDVIINGANEFHEYVPGVVTVDDVPVPLHSQWERRFTIGARERLSRTVREEELDEVAVDLATVVNGAPNSDRIVYFENKSYRDERSKQYIPEVIPGLVALRLGLRATSAAPILLEATIRMRDVGDKVAQDDDERLEVYPEAFQPVLPDVE